MVRAQLELMNKLRSEILSNNELMQLTNGRVILAYRMTTQDLSSIPAITISLTMNLLTTIYEVAKGTVNFSCWHPTEAVKCFEMAAKLKDLFHCKRVQGSKFYAVLKMRDLEVPRYDEIIKAYLLRINFDFEIIEHS